MSRDFRDYIVIGLLVVVIALALFGIVILGLLPDPFPGNAI